MTYRLIAKAVSIYVLFFSVCYAGGATYDRDPSFAEDVAISKQLAKTPLIKGEEYYSYIREDKALNSAYRKLSKSLDKKNLLLLKHAQRQWIEWRGKKCEAMQEAIHCGTLGCYGRVHDGCIVQMTIDRTLELHQFIRNKDEAAKQQFDFSRKNKHLDDD